MYFIIANPAAQSGQNDNRIIKKLEAALEAAHKPYFTCFSARPSYIRNFIKQFGQKEEVTLVAVGGDGTINGVVNAIEDFSKVKFAFLPIGSSNDLARGLGIKDIQKDPGQDDNIQKITEGKILRQMDLGELTYDDTGAKRRFAVSAGVGFDAAVCYEVNRSKFKNFFNSFNQGRLSYGTIALRELATIPKVQAKVTLDDGESIKMNKLIFVACMNTAYEGGGFRFAPDADSSSGKLNLAAIGDLNLAQILPKFPAAYIGKYYHFKGVHHGQGQQIHIELSQPLWVHTDGEVTRKSQAVTISCLPHCLNLIM
ncbi:diacylglycerol/lipid kinase family protein [Lactobacillus equicursoris]|uniref:diacylglycerol/lipid kinase family protein n=1 Tax=Lactobacillus equicursoris TaxID=420645 RepID=UPI0024326364|nr:diacylglycerol kinase family protein [Lactobacillus equicursoris]MDD6385985.1 diacylglycerol kinase family protein [Lactobacillus equicursoris]